MISREREGQILTPCGPDDQVILHWSKGVVHDGLFFEKKIALENERLMSLVLVLTETD